MLSWSLSQCPIRKADTTPGIWNWEVIIGNWLQMMKKLISPMWGQGHSELSNSRKCNSKRWRDHEKVVLPELRGWHCSVSTRALGLPKGGLWKQGVPFRSRGLVKDSDTTKKLLGQSWNREKYPGSSLPFTCQSLSVPRWKLVNIGA